MAKALPKKLGEAIDALYTARQERLDFQRSMDEKLKLLKQAQDQLEEHVMALLSAQGLEMGRGDVGTATLVKKVVGKVTDWAKLWSWAKKNDDLAIFQKRISNEHFKELLEAKEKVPGVEKVVLTEVSIGKAAQ